MKEIICLTGNPCDTLNRSSWEKFPDLFLEKIPGGVFGGNPQSNSWKKSSDECLEHIPGGILCGNPGGISRENSHSNSWGKFPDEFLEQILYEKIPDEMSFWSNSWRDFQRNFCKNSPGQNLRRNPWRKSPD